MRLACAKQLELVLLSVGMDTGTCYVTIQKAFRQEYTRIYEAPTRCTCICARPCHEVIQGQ